MPTKAQITASSPADELKNLERVHPPSNDKTPDDPPPQPHVTSAVTERIINMLIDKLEDRGKTRRLRDVFAHPLIVVLAGAVVGGVLTHYYTKAQKDIEFEQALKQQEIARRQSLLDGMNNVRVPKLGDVWEKLDADDLRINQLLDESTSVKASNDPSVKSKNIDEIIKIIRDDRALVGENRFWLGNSLYEKTERYIDATAEYALKRIGSPHETDLTALLKKREAAKQDILQIRELFLEGESK
jgi:hypothetical protein